MDHPLAHNRRPVKPTTSISSSSHNNSVVDADSQTSGPWASEPLSYDESESLKKYKYSGVDLSYLSKYILQPYWNWLAESFLPNWLAPNLITLIGFLPIVLFVGILSIIGPNLEGPLSGWFYGTSACVLWFYSTMDNLDGKQARATGTSGPLGELFDHGLDSLNCTLASLLHVAALGLGSTKTGAFAAILPCLPMYFSTWETYHTHTLFLGVVNGPTEGLVIAVIMMLMSAWYGPSIWATPVQDYIPILATDASIRDLWGIIMGGAFLIFHLPSCVVNVRAVYKKAGKPFLPILLEWVPISVFTVACSAWLGSPHSSLLRDNHLILFCLVLSLVFGRMTTKVIFAHLTRGPFPLWTYMMLPLVLGAFLINLPYLGFSTISASVELWYVRIYAVYAAVIYFRWAYVVINTICDCLSIQCFKIPYKKKNKLPNRMNMIPMSSR